MEKYLDVTAKSSATDPEETAAITPMLFAFPRSLDSVVMAQRKEYQHWCIPIEVASTEVLWGYKWLKRQYGQRRLAFLISRVIPATLVHLKYQASKPFGQIKELG